MALTFKKTRNYTLTVIGVAAAALALMEGGRLLQQAVFTTTTNIRTQSRSTVTCGGYRCCRCCCSYNFTKLEPQLFSFFFQLGVVICLILAKQQQCQKKKQSEKI